MVKRFSAASLRYEVALKKVDARRKTLSARRQAGG
jgi:hypothetical protein